MPPLRERSLTGEGWIVTRVLSALLLGSALFGILCLGSWYLRSDIGFADGYTIVGFPWSFWSAGGLAYSEEFRLAALIADLVLAMGAGYLAVLTFLRGRGMPAAR